MFFPEYLWISYGWYTDDFWKEPFVSLGGYEAFRNCTVEQMSQVVKGLVLVSHLPTFPDEDAEIIGYSVLSCT